VKRSLTLFARLLLAFLLVLLVSTASNYVAMEAFSPLFLNYHLQHTHTSAPLSDDTQAELRVAHQRAMRQATLWGGVVSLLAAGVVSYVVSSRIARPIKQMQRASRRIAEGNYRQRLSLAAPGEIADLAQDFNDMAATLESSEARRVELIGNVAHEFRTPLSSLHGYVEGLEDGLFQPTPEVLSACQRQLNRLESLIDDLSVLSRVESNAEPLQMEATSVSALLEGVADTFRPTFQAKGVRLELIDTEDAAALVFADPLRTLQVLTNLIANALRYTPQQGTVSLWADVDPKTRTVVFNVRDSGSGIEPSDLPHIFTRFYRGDKARGRDAGGGSGIGLTIAKHFVELQGGRIGVTSQPGHGSHFFFSLPLTSEAETPALS
jgi:signal transduction histidine kinase